MPSYERQGVEMVFPYVLIAAVRARRLLANAAWPVVLAAALTAVACGAAEDTSESSGTATPAAASSQADGGGETSASATTEPAGITVYAGTGKGSFEGDGGPATEASMYGPSSVAVDSKGNLYISTDNHRVRKVDASTGVMMTVAGNGSPGYGGDGGPAIEARLKLPRGLAVDNEGNLFIADGDNGRIRRVDALTGIITTVAGGGIPKRVSGVIDPGDGGLATDAFIRIARDVAVDDKGNVYFTAEDRVRKVDATTGVITTLTGTGINDLSGDGGPAEGAGIADPLGVTVDDQGNIYFADSYNQRVRRIDAVTGTITTVAGIGEYAPATHPDPAYVIKPEGQGFSGDGGPAASAMLATPTDLVIGPDGNLYIADTDNDRIRKVDLATGIITTFAEGGAVRGERMETGFTESGDVPITFTNFAPPTGIAATRDGVFYIADYGQNKVVRVTP